MDGFLEIDVLNNVEDVHTHREMINLNNIVSIVELTYLEDDDITKITFVDGNFIYVKQTYPNIRNQLIRLCKRIKT